MASQLILDSTSNDSSILLNFANNNLANKHDNSFFSFFPSVKHESNEDHMPSDVTYNRSPSFEYLLSPDHLTMFEPSAQMTVLSANHKDVISGMVDSVDLDYLLEF